MPSFWPLSAGWLCAHLWDHYLFTGDRDFLTRVLQSPPPLASAAVLPPAIEPMGASESARPLDQPLSLGAVFGDEPPVAPRGLDVQPAAPAAEPSYDEFFGAVAAGEPAAAGSAP